MTLKNKWKSMIRKFPTIAKIAGVKPYPEYEIPEPRAEDKALLHQYITDVNTATAKYNALNDKYIADMGPDDMNPDLIDAHELQSQATQKLQDFCIQHPELWTPGSDVAWFYDTDTLQLRMTHILSMESNYLNKLIQRSHELVKNKTSPDNVSRLNELSFVYELILDTERTIGDKCNEIWWHAIPDIIKHKYAKIMDDSMVKLLAESDELTDYVVNFWDKANDINKCRKFLKLLEQQMNKRLVVTDKPVRCLLAAKDNFKSDGIYNPEEIKVVVGYNCFRCGIDDVINTVKHEYFGHHIDNVAPNLGLQGETMAKFISQQFGTLQSHGGEQKWHLIAQSPLLKNHYEIDDISPESLNILKSQGWKVRKVTDKFEYEKYRKRFDEQTAFLVGETHDIVNKVLEYRRTHGITRTEKTQ